MSATLLIELLTEELPPKSLARLGLAFREQMQKSLAEAGFIAADNPGHWYATPRRLALQFENCLDKQPDRTLEKKGPAVASGLDAGGKPSKALEGFMRSAGVSFEQLEKTHDGKAEYFVAHIRKAGEAIDTSLAAMVEAALKKLPVARLMRWGAGEAQFVRPAHGLVMLHGTRVVPGRVLDLDSGNKTRGHRFLSKGEITIPDADQYRPTLDMQGRVVADFDRRRELIRKKLNDASGSLTWLQDEALLDEVTALVEFPVVYEARFDEDFLAVPQECLILTMKANQKYFPLMNGEKLTNRFLIVSNMEVADPVNIITGNARVVRPRLADAKFFFETDQKTLLEAQALKLDRIVYHNKLGSQGDRVQRLVKTAGRIASRLICDPIHAERAALLCKADLVTNMVGEFPELQGIMGRYYALHDGESAVVADAIEAHYHPRFNGDTLPEGRVACAVALADKLDALVGFFGIGQIPTGDKDPFGLRRAALGVLRILMETPLPLDLGELLDMTGEAFPKSMLTQEWKAPLLDFLRERLRHLLRDEGGKAGHDAKLVDAVLALHPTRIDLIPTKLAAVKTFAALPEADALAAANKRIVNILKKAEGARGTLDPALLAEDAEQALHKAIAAAAPGIETQLATGDYAAALKSLAGLRVPVDAFFDGVMVMVEDPAIRANRLALLADLARLMNRVADISRLS